MLEFFTYVDSKYIVLRLPEVIFLFQMTTNYYKTQQVYLISQIFGLSDIISKYTTT